MSEQTYEELQSEFEQLQAEMKDVMGKMQAQMAEKGKEYISKFTTALFAKYPELVNFAWTQYTPYFNDGETCYFGVNSEELHVNAGVVNEDHEDADDWGDGPFIYAYYSKYAEERAIKEGKTLPWWEYVAKDVNEFLATIGEELLQSFFGDHVQITVSKDGIDVTEHEHD